jgi:aryl-alcohol dehydrogenase-like predicted oxidoreductase
MKTRRLADSDLEVSEIALGTMTWGEQNREAEAHAQLDFAVAHGVTLVDTAEMYPAPPRAETQGRTEAYLGSWLAAQRARRDRLVVASKVAGPGRRDWIRGGRTDLAAANIVEACDASLARLGLSHLDLYQIHWPQRNVPMFGSAAFDPGAEKAGGPSIRDQVEGMGRLLDARKIRHWGLSNETSWGVLAFRQAARELGVAPPLTLQNSYSLVSRGPDGDLAEVLYRERVALLAYSPLAGGMLTGKYRGGARPEGARFTRFDNFGVRFKRPGVAEAIDAYAAIAARRGLTSVQLAIGWLRSRWQVGAIIAGATSVEQLAQSIDAASLGLDRETLVEIDAVQLRYPNPAP